MRALQLESLRALARPLAGARVLLYGLSGAGFPGGDGAREAEATLVQFGVDVTYTYARDPSLRVRLEQHYDFAIVTNTRVGELLQAPDQLWRAAPRTALWFWDLRPASVGAPLRGRVQRVCLSFNGRWLDPAGVVYDPADWARELGCPVGYAPQASPLREPVVVDGAPRVVFVGDLANQTFHRGRAELCGALGATVLNARQRVQRLDIEARLPGLYSSASYVLSTSPPAPGYTSVRTYSILACGGALLLQRFPGCEALFTDGENALIFDDALAALARIEQLDKQPEERARIASNGRRLHATTHTVAHRVLTICREMSAC